jgi:predicted TIM-barrel fold metal-dependent hydrolase
MERTLDKREVRELLARVQQGRGSDPFVDVHIHPFDVIFQSLRYRRQAAQAGVYGCDDTTFVPPEVGAVRLRGPTVPSTAWRPAFFMLLVRRLYRHTGPRVLADQLSLAGIDHALLLPVAPATGSNEAELDVLYEMFGGDPRFTLATSVPNGVPDHAVAPFVARAVERHRARAVKLHPAITGIDLGSAPGRERAEAVLDACRRSGVSLVVHGGRSYPAVDPRAGSYASIENLAAIRWREARVPVSIAHAGCYGHGLDEMERTVLPKLDAMLSANDNLFVDVSALEHDALALVLRRVPRERLLFGSDALYESPWSAFAKLACALQLVGMDVEASIARIAGRNPSRFLCPGSARHDDHRPQAAPAAGRAAAAARGR